MNHSPIDASNEPACVLFTLNVDNLLHLKKTDANYDILKFWYNTLSIAYGTNKKDKSYYMDIVFNLGKTMNRDEQFSILTLYFDNLLYDCVDTNKIENITSIHQYISSWSKICDGYLNHVNMNPQLLAIMSLIKIKYLCFQSLNNMAGEINNMLNYKYETLDGFKKYLLDSVSYFYLNKKHKILEIMNQVVDVRGHLFKAIKNKYPDDPIQHSTVSIFKLWKKYPELYS